MTVPPDLLNTILVVLEVALAILGGFIAALWISLVIWTFRDIRSRSRDVFAQLLATLLVLIFNVPGLLLYLILRPPERLVESYERALEEEALLQDIEARLQCPSCKRQIERDFILCPSCHTPLKKRCPNCDRILHRKWNICPYCGAAQTPAAIPQEKGSRARRFRDFRAEEEAETEPTPVLAEEPGEKRPRRPFGRRREEPTVEPVAIPVVETADEELSMGGWTLAEEDATGHMTLPPSDEWAEIMEAAPPEGGEDDVLAEMAQLMDDEAETFVDAPTSDEDRT